MPRRYFTKNRVGVLKCWCVGVLLPLPIAYSAGGGFLIHNVEMPSDDYISASVTLTAITDAGCMMEVFKFAGPPGVRGLSQASC